MPRRKAPAQDAPQTLDEAIGLLENYALLAAAVSDLEALREETLARIHAEHDRVVAEAETTMKDLFRRLKPWWAVARDALTEGKRKSIPLGGCIIGHRTPPPSLKAPTPEATALAALRTLDLATLIRDRPQLDKPAIIALLRLDPEDCPEGEWVAAAQRSLASCGFRVRQDEEFFIDRLPPKPVPTITEPEEIAA